jgi:hypothetical protein
MRRPGAAHRPRQPAAIARTSSRRARRGAASDALLDTRLASIPIAQRLGSGFVQPVSSPPSRRRTSRHCPTSSRRAARLKTLCVLRPAPTCSRSPPWHRHARPGAGRRARRKTAGAARAVRVGLQRGDARDRDGDRTGHVSPQAVSAVPARGGRRRVARGLSDLTRQGRPYFQ